MSAPFGRLVAGAALVAAPLTATGCAYYNTLYNANAKFDEAQDQKRRADPEREKISTSEERLYTEAFEKAARVVKYWPESKWVDDALLLMGRSSFEKGDYSTALRKFDEILTFYPDSELTAEALLMKGRTLIETRDYEEGIRELTRAAEMDDDHFRDDVTYFLGLVQEVQGNPDEAVVHYADVVSRYRKSEWFAEAGLRAGRIEEERGNADAAVAFYERVRAKARDPEERYRGGIRKGEALVKLAEYDRAKTTFHDVAKRTLKEEDRGDALVRKGRAAVAAGNIDEGRKIFEEILVDFERRAAAAAAQLEIARIADRAGDLEAALADYDLVKDQGTGHPAWRDASERRAEIQRVLDLRAAIEDEADPDREKNRFLLAEQLLERIGDVDAAMAEYAALEEEAAGTEWGARALFAQAWVAENRLQDPARADSLFFRLANRYTASEVNAAARRRLGYPVWPLEVVEPPAVEFIRPEGGVEPTDIVLERVAPRDVPLPPGVSQVQVWVRVQVAADGTAANSRVVKSGGEEFDAAALEAAQASRFLGTDAGGPEYTVMQYSFPPEGLATDDEPSAEERDALLDAQDAAATTSIPPPPPAAVDSTRLQPGTPQFRDRKVREGDD